MSEQDKVVAGVPAGECRIDLADFRFVRITGEDAETFLQGQFSSDVRELDGTNWQYSSYSTAKGRVIANFMLGRMDGAFWMVLPADIAAATCKRLTMFVMRSKVRLELVEDQVLAGLTGARFAGVPHAAGSYGDGMLLHLPSGAALFAGPSLPADLAGLPEADAAVWSLSEIDAGIPWVTQATQEAFVPQMLNLDVLGGISFRKGCYPGQEIVARTRYLGSVKRRVYRVSLSVMAPAGSGLFSPATGDQQIGQVVNVVQMSDGQYRALISVQIAAWAQGIYLDREFKQPVFELALPYSVDIE